ncbi:hypothetical protein HDU99_008946, partial [Rhizoclosmatium hyalinum]
MSTHFAAANLRLQSPRSVKRRSVKQSYNSDFFLWPDNYTKVYVEHYLAGLTKIDWWGTNLPTKQVIPTELGLLHNLKTLKLINWSFDCQIPLELMALNNLE